jgi:hypothetical protein
MTDRRITTYPEFAARRRARAAARAPQPLSLQQLKAAVSMGLELADYDARLQRWREAEKLAKLEEEP